jgi:tRNA (cytidine/uridine-2'-O-)-methyltransferase
MIDVVLFEPEIPQNTGNIIRLCANAGMQLHLIHPLGFTWDDKRLRRAGLDYHEFAKIQHYQDWQDFWTKHQGRAIFALTTHATKHYHEIQYPSAPMLLFGPESRGLPPAIREQQSAIRIPMQAQSRSLNLSNAVAIVAYEVWRQQGFLGGN